MLRHYLPNRINQELFGFREQHGQKADMADKDWQKWLSIYPSVYRDTQKTSKLAQTINNAGYTVLKDIDLTDCTVAEIGPGGGYHFDYFKGIPKKYDVFDVCSDFFEDLKNKASKRNIPITTHQIEAYTPLFDLPDNSVDYMLAFYVVEHLYPLEDWIKEIFRVLKPGGSLIGAIPAEGGVLWALGRFATSRRILNKKYDLDIRKIVCWEHPNMSDDIIKSFAPHGNAQTHKWPFSCLPLDTNLVIQFKVEKT